MDLVLLFEAVGVQFLCLVFPIILFILYLKWKKRFQKQKYKKIDKEIGIDNLLANIGITSVSFPLIFVCKDKQGISYISELTFNSINDYKNQFFLENNILTGEIEYAVDSSFNTFSLVSKPINLFGVNSNNIILTFNIRSQKETFDNIESILLDENSGYGFLFEDEIINYKNKNLSKNMQTIVNIIRGES